MSAGISTNYQRKFGIGLSADDVNVLDSLGKSVFGSGRGEGVNGGKGYVGIFIDQLGGCHAVKMLTRFSERSFTAKGDVQKMLAASSDGARAALEASANFEKVLLNLAAQATKFGGEDNFSARVQQKIQDYKDSLQVGKKGAERNQVLYSRQFAASLLKMFSEHIATRTEADKVAQGLRDDPEKNFEVTSNTVSESLAGFKFTAEKFNQSNRAPSGRTSFRALGELRKSAPWATATPSLAKDDAVKHFEARIPTHFGVPAEGFSDDDFSKMREAVNFLEVNGVGFGGPENKFGFFKKLAENYDQFEADLGKHMFESILKLNYGVTAHPENIQKGESDLYDSTVPYEQRRDLYRKYNKSILDGFMLRMTKLVDAIRKQPVGKQADLIKELVSAVNRSLCFEGTHANMEDLLTKMDNGGKIYEQRPVVNRAMAIIGDFLTDNNVAATKDLTEKQKSALKKELRKHLEGEELEMQNIVGKPGALDLRNTGKGEVIPKGYVEAHFDAIIAYYREILAEDF